MKVLFITHSFSRSEGGVSASPELLLATALRDEGVEVLILAPGPGEQSEDINGIAIERFPVPRREMARATTQSAEDNTDASWRSRITTLRFLSAEFTSAVRARREFEPDLVHAHWWFPGGLVGTWVSALGNVPLVTSLHRVDLRAAQAGAFGRPLFRHVMRHSAVVTADSHGLARKAKSTIGAQEPVVAPMPARADLYVPGGERTTDRLLLVSDLDPDQGIEDSLRALALMRAKVSIDIVGQGPRENEYRALAESLSVSARVRWHTGTGAEDLPRFFQAAAALVVPSLTDWLPPVAVHALLCRTPVVAFDFGGVTDVIQHGRTGILVPPGDSLALSRALDALLARSDAGANLGEAGRMYALATFAPESVARRFAGIYRQALAASPP